MLNLRTIDERSKLGSLLAPVYTRCQVTSSAMEDECTTVTQEGNTSAVAVAVATAVATRYPPSLLSLLSLSSLPQPLVGTTL